MKQHTLAALCLAALSVLVLAPSAPAQQSDFFIVAVGKNLGQVVTVAKSGGDFTSVQEAVASISDASAAKPYTVVVGPGVFYGRVIMKPYVNLLGSGEGSTILTAPGDANEDLCYTLRTATNAEARNLTVKNTGGYYFGTAVLNKQAAPRLIHVTAKATGASVSIAIRNDFTGLVAPIVSPYLESVTADADGTALSVGIYNYSTLPILKSVLATANGGAGVRHGMYNSNEGYPKGFDCRFEGATAAVSSTSGSGWTYLANSQLDGGRDGTSFSCVQCFTGTFTQLGAQCQ